MGKSIKLKDELCWDSSSIVHGQTKLIDILSFSTKEHIVGTYLGKPLYAKTIYFGSLPNNGSKTVSHGISNMEFIPIKLVSWYDTNDKAWLHGDRIDSPTIMCKVYVRADCLYIEAVGTNWASRTKDGYCTIIYTKTTD